MSQGAPEIGRRAVHSSSLTQLVVVSNITPMSEIEPGRRSPRKEGVGRWARLGRALGDIFLTAGMSKGLQGTAAMASSPPTNVILFGEGDAEGREANRGSNHD